MGGGLQGLGSKRIRPYSPVKDYYKYINCMIDDCFLERDGLIVKLNFRGIC